MAYSDKVVDHFNNPRNVGSLDKNDPDVGTGIVGAPECFHADTLIATADGSKTRSIKEIFSSKEILPVWSYNIDKQLFEIKKAKAVYSGQKLLEKVFFDDNSSVSVTPDHKFLLRPSYIYKENRRLLASEIIRPFRRYVSKRGYWRIRDTKDQYEYLELYKFVNPKKSLKGFNVHHKDHNKKNDYISNLELESISDHLNEHRDSFFKEFKPKFSKEIIKSTIEKTYARPEAANELGIYVDELYAHLRYFDISGKKRKTKDEVRLLASERMKTNNPYRSFTEQQKQAFASHQGSSNGRWIKAPNEKLLLYGHLLYKFTGKLNAEHWRAFAKHMGLPQNITSRFSSWNSFKKAIINYNHRIISRQSIAGLQDCYTLQVEKNNNYVVITSKTKNVQEGIVVKNCGDVMRLQIKIKDGIIEEAKFKTFGCGSAIASSSLATEWIKGKSIDEANSIKNVQIVEELSLPPVKIHCSVLAEDAIKAAIQNYKDKQNVENKDNARTLRSA